MMKASLYIRVRMPDGKYLTTKPVFSAKGRIRPGYALIDGTAERFDSASYVLRYGKTWETVGDEANDALTALERKNHELKSVKLGISVEPSAAPTRSLPVAKGRSLVESIRSYMDEVKAHKSKKTVFAYTETLLSFVESIDRDSSVDRQPLKHYLDNPSARLQTMTIEGITRTDMLGYKTFLEKRGNSPRTVSNRIDYFQIFLHHFGLPSLLKGKDKPKYTAKKVRGYNGVELGKMFEQATIDEADLLHFLLCTGTREGEMQFACWSDVDLVAKTYTVTEHRQLGFIPKDKEEGTIPLPDVLVDRMIARRKRYPKSQLIFLTKENSPEGHALRIVKRLALRAGVNCGHCVNKQGKSCATHPVCYHVFLHKLRKTYATTLHNNGVSARTIMGFLRHSELNTTLRYLADGDDEQTRATINKTFNGFGGGAA
jgi:integrase